MGKNKLARFEETLHFENVFQPSPQKMFEESFEMKGKWNSEYFKNNNPIILELGCGRGEYTIGMAEKYPDKNFIGMDIKGARIWRGSKTAFEKNMKNVAFIRNKIEFINSFFENNEVSEIWITFPDPQLKKQKKRLTSSRFLSNYANLLKQDGIIHLKTDSQTLHNYTLDLINLNKLDVLFADNNIYKTESIEDILKIKTFYEEKFLEKGMPITYLKFKLNNIYNFLEPIKI